MGKYDDENRYVVTGMGLASPVGNDTETAWQNILAGEHGVQYVRDTLLKGYESLPTYVAAPVKDFDLAADSTFANRKKDIRSKWDSCQQFVLWAGAQALRQASLSSAEAQKVSEHGLAPEDFGIIFGTGIGGAYHIADAALVLEREKDNYARVLEEEGEEVAAALIGETRLNPKTILKTLPGRATGGTASIEFGAKGLWGGSLQECASGNAAIIAGIEAIKLGKVKVALVGGVEGDITPVTTGLFAAAHAVTQEKDPNKASRPLDTGRDGLVMGQGAGALVVETLAHAQKRGVVILAEIIGYAANSDAYAETDPDPENVAACMAKATKSTGQSRPGNIALNLHGTSTPLGDAAEIVAAKMAYDPSQITGITAIKSRTGHTFGAAGAIEAITSVLMVRDSTTPAINNLENPIPEAADFAHALSGDTNITGEIDMVVNNSFGFSGNNAITIFANPR